MSQLIPAQNRPWLELLHAEASYTLSSAGVEVLFVKGPVTSILLGTSRLRDYADVDAWIHPKDERRAIKALKRRGFRESTDAFRWGEVADHAIDLKREDSELGLHGIDLHTRIPHLGKESSASWLLAWKRRTYMPLAGVSIAITDPSMSALIIALHALRSGRRDHEQDDLRLLVQQLSLHEWQRVESIALELSCFDALGEALATMDASLPRRVFRTRFPPGGSSRMKSSAGRQKPHSRWSQFREAPWRRKPVLALNAVYPSAQYMIKYGGATPGSRMSLVRAHARRLLRVTPSDDGSRLK